MTELKAPHNAEAEARVLGSALLDCRVLDDLAPVLRPEDFYRARHQVAYREMLALRHGGGPVDLVTLHEHLSRRGLLEEAGGERGLCELAECVPHAGNARHYAGIVIELATARRVMAALGEGLALMSSGRYDRPVAELVAEIETRVLDAGREHAAGEVHEAADAAAASLDELSHREAGIPAGLRTGFSDFDDLLDGFRRGQLIVLAARPGQGKTSLAIDIASHATLVEQKSVLFSSLEMGRVELADRILSSRARVEGAAIRSGHGIKGLGRNSMGRVYEALRYSRFAIDDAASRSVAEIAAIARRRKASKGLDLVVVDYLQLVRPAATKNSNRQEQVAQISRDLKCLAKDCDVPVLALSQLNRDVEKRSSDDQRPRLSDLRESGAIEQDADAVLFLHHEKGEHGPTELIVAKNRSGPTGVIRLSYLREFTTFESWCPFPAGVPVPGAAF